MKCSECIHDHVCMYKDARAKLEGDKSSFVAGIVCRFSLSRDMRSFMKEATEKSKPMQFMYTYPEAPKEAPIRPMSTRDF